MFLLKAINQKVHDHKRSKVQDRSHCCSEPFCEMFEDLVLSLLYILKATKVVDIGLARLLYGPLGQLCCIFANVNLIESHTLFPILFVDCELLTFHVWFGLCMQNSHPIQLVWIHICQP